MKRMTLTAISLECLHNICFYLGIQETLQLEEVCKSISHQLTENFFWQTCIDAHFPSYNLRGVNIDLCRRIVNKLWRNITNQNFYHLENDIIATSSIDRKQESPRNTLFKSTCFTLLSSERFQALKSRSIEEQIDTSYHIQRHCQCAGQRPCYWSSHPTPNPLKIEFLTIQLCAPLSCVVGFTVTPYQAFFHPNAPVYGPREVSIQILTHVNNDNRKQKNSTGKYTYDIIPVTTESELSQNVIFQSEFYPVENKFATQICYLPSPVMCIGGEVRLVLRGFNQRQTINMDGDIDAPEEDFYMCLAGLNIIGIPLSGYEISDPEDAVTVDVVPLSGVNTDKVNKTVFQVINSDTGTTELITTIVGVQTGQGEMRDTQEYNNQHNILPTKLASSSRYQAQQNAIRVTYDHNAAAKVDFEYRKAVYSKVLPDFIAKHSSLCKVDSPPKSIFKAKISMKGVFGSAKQSGTIKNTVQQNNSSNSNAGADVTVNATAGNNIKSNSLWKVVDVLVGVTVIAAVVYRLFVGYS